MNALMIPDGFKFRIEELVDRQSFLDWGEHCWTYFHPEALEMLHGIRMFLGRPITVNNWLWGGPLSFRGYRGPACMIGAVQSYHRRGMAFDFDVKGLTAEDALDLILANQDHEWLMPIQRMERGIPWVHADIGAIPRDRTRIYLFRP